MGSISHHITPLIINSLRGEHTHTQTRILTFVDKAILRKPGRHIPGLKTHPSSIASWCFSIGENYMNNAIAKSCSSW